MAKNENATPSNSTSGGKVSLVMHKSQWPSSAVEVEGETLSRTPVEVDAKKAERILERRDENGKAYAAEA